MHTTAYSWPEGFAKLFNAGGSIALLALLTLLAPCVHFPVEGLPSDAEEETSGAPPLLQCCFIAAAAAAVAVAYEYTYIYMCKSL